eukprot:CAMPEP_0185012080 /NCGR_PEP_ID=MMETSP1098-20130426/98114_2 /TAXON_ID=89044 /ORGANISM="Spumella elongata, Strain CCAP 955/1" /LENGTH=384 /DNA_ID=CAMNT_0027541129 /DNA_START=1898 /DNA_END=3052 /DNA_ORIENTATION=-
MYRVKKRYNIHKPVPSCSFNCVRNKYIQSAQPRKESSKANVYCQYPSLRSENLHYCKINTTSDLYTLIPNLVSLFTRHVTFQTQAFAGQTTSTSLFAVEVAVDHAGDGLDLGGQLLLDLVQREAVLVGDEVDGQTEVAEATRATNAVEVGLGALGEVEVDHNVHALDVDTAGEQIRAHQVAGRAVAELVEHSVTIGLLHLGVNVKAGVAELGDLLGQELHAVHAVAEDDALVDVELGEQRVEAVHLLLLLHKGVVLGDTSQGQLVHEVDHVGIGEELLLEGAHGHGEGGTEQADLAVALALADQGLEDLLELRREKLVGLVHHDDLALGQVGDALVGEIVHTARSGDHHVHGRVEADDIITQVGATSGGHDLDLHVLGNLHHDG